MSTFVKLKFIVKKIEDKIQKEVDEDQNTNNHSVIDIKLSRNSNKVFFNSSDAS